MKESPLHPIPEATKADKQQKELTLAYGGNDKHNGSMGTQRSQEGNGEDASDGCADPCGKDFSALHYCYLRFLYSLPLVTTNLGGGQFVQTEN